MEIEKVIRIVAAFIALVAFAVWVATEVFFPEAHHSARIVQLIVMSYCLWMVWAGKRKNTTQK